MIYLLKTENEDIAFMDHGDACDHVRALGYEYDIAENFGLGTETSIWRNPEDQVANIKMIKLIADRT